MFILSPHIVDLDAEMLARLQSSRLRDVTEAEQIDDDAEASDAERRRRDLERADARQRRAERDEDAYRRREAEIRHGQEMRKVDRTRKRRFLSEDIRQWQEEERAARAQLADERLALEAQAAAEAAVKAEAAKAAEAKEVQPVK